MNTLELVLKRICELQKGDRFLYFGLVHVVRRIENERIYYSYENNGDNRFHSFGAKCQAKVEMIN